MWKFVFVRTVKLKTGAFFLFDFFFFGARVQRFGRDVQKGILAFRPFGAKVFKKSRKKFARVSPGGQPPRLFEKRIAAPYRY